MNQLPAVVIDAETVRVLDLAIPVKRRVTIAAPAIATLLVRPEDTNFAANGGAGLAGSVVGQTFQGVATTVTVRLHTLDVLIAVHVVGSVDDRLQPGDPVTVTVDGSHAVVEPVDAADPT
jgi:ABC-type Fe3+/spermidine/putrescine transport system ATPase subunit